MIRSTSKSQLQSHLRENTSSRVGPTRYNNGNAKDSSTPDTGITRNIQEDQSEPIIHRSHKKLWPVESDIYHPPQNKSDGAIHLRPNVIINEPSIHKAKINEFVEDEASMNVAPHINSKFISLNQASPQHIASPQHKASSQPITSRQNHLRVQYGEDTIDEQASPRGDHYIPPENYRPSENIDDLTVQFLRLQKEYKLLQQYCTIPSVFTELDLIGDSIKISFLEDSNLDTALEIFGICGDISQYICEQYVLIKADASVRQKGFFSDAMSFYGQALHVNREIYVDAVVDCVQYKQESMMDISIKFLPDDHIDYAIDLKYYGVRTYGPLNSLSDVLIALRDHILDLSVCHEGYISVFNADTGYAIYERPIEYGQVVL